MASCFYYDLDLYIFQKSQLFIVYRKKEWLTYEKKVGTVTAIQDIPSKVCHI